MGCTFVRRGDAGGGIHQLAGLASGDFLLRSHRGGFLEHRQECGFHDQAVGLVGSGFAHDDASRRRLGGGVEAVHFQGQAVQHGTVHGHVVDTYRIVRKCGIEIIAVKQTSGRHHGIVIAVTDDQFAFRNLPGGCEGLQAGDDAVDILARAGRRRIQHGLIGHGQRVVVVGVSVDETGQQGTALQVDLARVLAGQLVGLGLAADEADFAVFDRERLHILGLITGHGQDIASGIDRIGGVVGFTCTTGQNRQSHQQRYAGLLQNSGAWEGHDRFLSERGRGMWQLPPSCQLYRVMGM